MLFEQTNERNVMCKYRRDLRVAHIASTVNEGTFIERATRHMEMHKNQIKVVLKMMSIQGQCQFQRWENNFQTRRTYIYAIWIGCTGYT